MKLRPAVLKENGDLEKIIKYIPAEIIAAYTALVGVLPYDPLSPTHFKVYYFITLIILLVVTPFWIYYGVTETGDSRIKIKRSLFHAIIALFGFAIYVISNANPFLINFLCGESNPTDCDIQILGSIILIIFTVITPLLEKIFFPDQDQVNDSNNT